MPAGRARVNGSDEGERPSGTALMALVDRADPAFLNIVGVLHEMRSAGVDFDESVVRAAVALGRSRQKSMPQPDDDLTGSSTSRASSSGPIVYYARRSDLVKIGTTQHPYKRFAALLPDEILAWEPGARAEEQARHQMFAGWRLGGSEFFQINEMLTRHIEGLRRTHGEPDPEWPTLASVSTIGALRVVRLSTPADSVLVTVGEGVQALGIKRNTADMWVRRKLLAPAGRTGAGRPLYLLSHMNELAERSGLLPDALA